MSPDDPRHGTYAGAVAHWFDRESLCPGCELAERRYRRRRQRRLLDGDSPTIPAVGTVRRFQALMALGWRGPEIAQAAGISIHTLRSLQYHASSVVLTATAEGVASAYERMSMTVPQGPYANRTRIMAKRRGWAPPLAWDNIDDPDERPARPEKVDGRKTADRVIEDVEWLADNDLSLSEVIRRLDYNRDTLRDLLRREGRGDLYWRLANREPDAEQRRATRDGIRRSKEVA